MEIEFLSRKDNTLLQRVELQFRITHQGEGSPDREAVRDVIAKREKVGKELVIIDHMRSDYGLPSTNGFAKVYKSKENIMDTERKHILIRNKLLADDRKKAAPKPKEKKPETEPKEEAEKEQKKPEDKKESPKDTKAKEEKDVKTEKDTKREDDEKDETKKPRKGEPKKEKDTEKNKK